MYKTIFDKIHKPQISRIFKDKDQSDKRVGEKLAEYSAVSGTPIIECYMMYVSLFGKTEYATGRLLDLRERNS